MIPNENSIAQHVIQNKNGITKHVNVNAKKIISVKKIIVGIPAYAFLRIVSIYKDFKYFRYLKYLKIRYYKCCITIELI